MLSHLDRSLSLNTDMVVANSSFTARQVERVYGLGCATVAYPPVDTSFFTPGDRVREEAILTVAALSKFKRVDFLLRVFARVVKTQPQLVYHVVGTGDEADSSVRRKMLRLYDRRSIPVFCGDAKCCVSTGYGQSRCSVETQNLASQCDTVNSGVCEDAKCCVSM